MPRRSSQNHRLLLTNTKKAAAPVVPSFDLTP
jgi:hypothetical protein